MLKAKLLFLATFIVGMSIMKISAQTTYEWDYVSSLPNEWLQKICTQGIDTVYVVGRNGLIAKSINRTATWTKKYPVATQLNDIIFCNHTTGFAVGNNGTILKTTDAGTNWTQLNSGITANLNAIIATGTDNIWAVGDYGKVIFSTNAGVNWQIKDLSTTDKLNDISFRNNVGYIVGNAHTCFVTSDYGQNWTIKDVAVENPYNYNVSFFCLLSVNQTQNHTSILIGDEYITGWFINVDNNIFIRPGSTVTNFTMKNDSIGFASSAACTTGGSSGCIVRTQIFNLNKIDPYAEQYMEASNFAGFDDHHSDMSFVNDSTGYLATGSSLFCLKKYIPPIIDGLKSTTKNELSIMFNKNILTIQFENSKVYKIELFNIAGLKILTENIDEKEISKDFNISDFSKGTYIIRAYNRDNTFINIKWIKQ